MPFRRVCLVIVVAAFGSLSFAMSASVRAAADPKVVDKCQTALKKQGAKFVAKKLGALAKCTDPVFKCIQTIDESADAGAKRTVCITKARSACPKSLAKITAARQAFVAAASAACTALDDGQVSGDDGLGFAGTDCSEFGVTVTNVATLAECLAAQHNCLASRMFQLGMPRALEMLQFVPPPAVVPGAADGGSLACFVDHGGTGADVDDVVLGKAIVKCQKAIEKAGAKLASTQLKTLEKCIDALFTCAQTKLGDEFVKCRDKARAGCQKALDKSPQQRLAIAAGIDKPCGDPTLFAALLTPAGSDLAALLPPAITRAGPLSCGPLASAADLQTCLLTQSAGAVGELVRFQAPQGESLLGEVGCDLDACGPAPTPTVTPTLTFIPTPTAIETPTKLKQILSSGPGRFVSKPIGIATDGNGTVYVMGTASRNVFKITPTGTITQIMSDTTDHPFRPGGLQAFIAVDGDTVYPVSENDLQYKITGNGTITKIFDDNGDGTNLCQTMRGIAVDGNHNLYVTCFDNHSAFKITPAGTITQIITSASGLSFPNGAAADTAGNVWVTGQFSDAVFKISNGSITVPLNAAGDGAHFFENPSDISVNKTNGTFCTAGIQVHVGQPDGGPHVFRVTSAGSITRIMGQAGDGAGHVLEGRVAVAMDSADNCYVAGQSSNNVFKIAPNGAITLLMTSTGDGTHPLSAPSGIAADATGVYVTGMNSNNVFRIAPD